MTETGLRSTFAIFASLHVGADFIMSLSNYAENAVIDKLHRNINFTVTTPFIALHTGAPGETGANEMAGGSYARQSATFGAAAGGVSSNSGVVSFTGLPAAPAPGVIAWSMWDAVTAGNCIMTHWLTDVGALLKPFTVVDTATDLFLAPAHGYVNGDIVSLSTEIGATAIPAGVVVDTLYFIVNTATDSFQLALTSGGAAINITGKGSGTVIKVVPKTINAGDRLDFNTATLSVTVY
jgi:hypothetical protein